MNLQSRARVAALLATLLALPLTAASAAAHAAEKPAARPAGEIPAEADEPEADEPEADETTPRGARITGFKSAQFGIDENQVRIAIAKDFAIDGEGVTKSQGEAGATILRVLAPRLNRNIPDHPTLLTYLLDGASGKLTQVTLLWGTDLTPGMSVPDLNTKAALYRLRLMNADFPQDKTMTLGTLKDGSRLLFRGEDAEGHVVLLRSRVVEIERQVETGEGESRKAETRRIRAKRLLLSYIDATAAAPE